MSIQSMLVNLSMGLIIVLQADTGMEFCESR